MLLDNITEISQALSSKRENSAETFKKTLKDFSQCRYDLSQANKKLAISEAKGIKTDKENYCYFCSYNDIEILRGIVNELKKNIRGVATALCGNEESGYIFVSTSDNTSMIDVASKLKDNLNAKCGGSSAMIQGSIFDKKEHIEKILG